MPVCIYTLFNYKHGRELTNSKLKMYIRTRIKHVLPKKKYSSEMRYEREREREREKSPNAQNV